MAVSGYIPKVRMTLRGGLNPKTILQGSEAAVRLQILTQAGAAVGANITDVRYALLNKADGAYINSRSAVRANQTITLSSGLAADEEVTIAGRSFVFKSSPSTVRQVALGADENAAATNLAAAIAALSPECTASAVGAVVTVKHRYAGTNGNSVGLTKTGSHITLGGANLASGTDGVDTGDNTDDQEIPLLAADNTIVDSGLSEGALETHILRVTVKFTSGINDPAGNALDTLTYDFEFTVQKVRALSAA